MRLRAAFAQTKDLGTGDLRSRSPGASAVEFQCAAPPRVLVRVRAVFRAPTSVESASEALSAQGEISEASIAVRTQAGKPPALGSVSGSGKARLFASRSCLEDDT
jgi:hypothetical protein